MGEIQEAMQNSTSYLQFTDKLANINNKLFFTVSAKDQKGLQRVIAALYYTMDVLDDLAAEGLIKGSSEKAQFGIKTQKAGFSFLISSNLVALSGDSRKSWWSYQKEAYRDVTNNYMGIIALAIYPEYLVPTMIIGGTIRYLLQL